LKTLAKVYVTRSQNRFDEISLFLMLLWMSCVWVQLPFLFFAICPAIPRLQNRIKEHRRINFNVAFGQQPNRI